MWEEHKKFIIGIGGTAIGLLLFYLMVLSPIWEETVGLREKQAGLRLNIKKQSQRGFFQSQTGLKNLRDEHERLTKKLNGLKNRVNFRVTPEYALAMSGSDMLIDFHQNLQETRQRLKKMAIGKGVVMPASLGFPQADIQSTAIPTYFEKLDMMNQLVPLALESGCREILKVGWEKDFPELVSGVIEEKKLFSKNMIGLEAKGSFSAVTRFIYALQTAPRLLPIERISVTNENPEVDSVNIKVLVSGIKIKD